MASVHSSAHRRRSRSASISSPTARRSPDCSLRIAAKRLYPTHASGSSNISLPHKWDVDAWRRGKRRRRDPSPPEINMSFPEAAEQYKAPRLTEPSGFAFPSSSAEFNLFPKSNQSSRRRASYSPPRSDSGLPNSLNHTELTHLRSNAFWELHRSVAENGEGFVQRMRDYEHVRSCQSGDPTRRGRKRGFHLQATRNAYYIASSDESGDDEDIQILAEELTVDPNSCSPRHGKRAVLMDVSYHHLRNGEQEYHRFPHQNQPSSMLFEGDSLPVISGSPLSPSAFSFSSTDPSLLSSPTQSQYPDADDCSPSFSLPSSLSPSVSASSLDRTHTLPSEKSISDIALALANGAAAINDYSCLQNLTSFEHMDGGGPGELWH